MATLVEPFIPNPTRCFKCQIFGDYESKCAWKPVLAKRAEEHEGDTCFSPVKCLNCSGQHPAYNKRIRNYQLEKQIQTNQIHQNITFPEARKIVETQNSTLYTSYT